MFTLLWIFFVIDMLFEVLFGLLYWIFKILFYFLDFIFALIFMPFGYRPSWVGPKGGDRYGKFYKTLESQILEPEPEKKVGKGTKYAQRGMVILVSLVLLSLLGFLSYSGFKEGKSSFGMSMLGITLLIGIVVLFKIKEILKGRD